METVLYSRMEGEQKRESITASAAALKERLLAGELETGEDRMQILAELLRLQTDLLRSVPVLSAV